MFASMEHYVTIFSLISFLLLILSSILIPALLLTCAPASLGQTIHRCTKEFSHHLPICLICAQQSFFEQSQFTNRPTSQTYLTF
jgi:hypothetical protein